ncbi:ribonuclease Y-like [Haliotis asinina]|uniref:ribonuclease Y-like n=1 Tax=Haliotis asinina TaxID=109174 RepID=UPI003531ED16
MAKRATVRGRMKHEDELCIQKHILEIEKGIEAKDLTGPLFSRKLIDMNDMEFIQAGDTRQERARRLLNTLVLRGPASFQGFIESLEVMGYDGLVKLLRPSYERDLKSLLLDNEMTTDLKGEVDILKQRVGQVEQTSANIEDIRVLRRDVTKELKSVRITLQKIEELSRISKETILTTNSLRQQLDEKEQLLAEARKQIVELQAKVGNLEAENALLKGEIVDQRKQIVTLKKVMGEDKQKMETRLREMEAAQERDRRATQAEINKLRREQQANTDQMIAALQSLTGPVIDKPVKKTGTLKGMLNVKPIVPRHRFQDKI